MPKTDYENIKNDYNKILEHYKAKDFDIKIEKTRLKLKIDNCNKEINSFNFFATMISLTIGLCINAVYKSINDKDKNSITLIGTAFLAYGVIIIAFMVMRSCVKIRNQNTIDKANICLDVLSDNENIIIEAQVDRRKLINAENEDKIDMILKNTEQIKDFQGIK